MGELNWIQVDDGYDAGIYRVRRQVGTDAPGWRLEVAAPVASTRRNWVIDSLHGSRRRALATAEELERLRTRRLRITGHLAFGSVAAIVFVAVSSSMDSLGDFVVAMLAMFLGLRAFVSAVSVRLADAWGWQRDDGAPRVTCRDRLVIWVLDAVRRHPATQGTESTAVRVLPPSHFP